MKNITILIILGLFLISMTTIQTLTSRSKQQVVLHSNDINALTNSINKYYFVLSFTLFKNVIYHEIYLYLHII